MHISSIQTETQDETTTISASIDDFELWFQVPRPFGRADVADPFVAAALLPAMKRGENIVVDPAIKLSYTLFQGIKQLQDIYQAWWPKLQKINIEATIAPSPVQHQSYASFFSGGVDSLYSFYTHQKEIDYLIFLHGVDIQLDNHNLREEVSKRNQVFANQHGAQLVEVTTNIRYFAHHCGYSWSHHFCGAGLGSIALLLGFRHTLIPASQPFVNLYPDGSTPVADHLFSSEATQIYYDGGLIRHEKIQYLATQPEAMALLRVCWQDNGYNCGHCEKCLRTMLILRIFDITCPSLPRLQNLSDLKDWRISDEGEAYIFKNLLRAAKAADNREIYNFLRLIDLRERLKRGIVALDKQLFLGKLKSVFTAIKQIKNR
ncbi:hypothetical protein [Motiliproteus sp. MSK22-1]|uniref:hypothetical protein n=1 Tax=Motiliproteus sp. MSK22-1 TaxID=1897630 RepID=UPI0009753B25|nr:hypothetical protein [Motiliproteus sp. MSK22-1]OMH38060.1 hypothetical protein BGP75_07195 [Motiliproteus sp. MSK22-1]